MYCIRGKFHNAQITLSHCISMRRSQHQIMCGLRTNDPQSRLNSVVVAPDILFFLYSQNGSRTKWRTVEQCAAVDRRHGTSLCGGFSRDRAACPQSVQPPGGKRRKIIAPVPRPCFSLIFVHRSSLPGHTSFALLSVALVFSSLSSPAHFHPPHHSCSTAHHQSARQSPSLLSTSS